jgi:hypothetical protein
MKLSQSLGLAVSFVALTALANDSGRGRHKQFYVVPAPGTVAIDGALDEWDLSGQIEMFVIEASRATRNAKIAAMYDRDALYLSGEIADETPLMNRHDPKINPDKAWDADAVQFRLTLDPTAGYPVRETTFDYKGKQAKPDTRDDIVHLLLWNYTDDGQPCLSMQKGMTYRPGRPDWLPKGLVPADKFTAAYRKWDGGNGYTFEYRIPWSTFGIEGPPTPGGTVAGSVNVTWSRADGLAHVRVEGVSYDIMGSSGFPFQSTACWGKVIFARNGDLPRELVEAGVPPERQQPLSFSYALPQAGEVTLQLERPDGTVVRILEPQQSRQAGNQTVAWDGMDYQGRVLPAGEYRWRGIVAPAPVKAEFRFSVHNSGKPPYTTDDGKGGWGGDHGTPKDVVAVENGMLLSWSGAEYGSGTIRVTLDGTKQWGIPSCAEHLATDGVRYYAAGDHHSGTTIGIFEVATARPALIGNTVAGLAPPPGGAEEANRVTGLVWHEGVLYVSYAARNLIARYSTVDGGLQGTWAVPNPGQMAVRPDGSLAVVSAGRVVTVKDGNATPWLTTHLDAPKGIAIATDGTVYVANRGAFQNVSVFDRDGHYLRSIGTQGGRPAVGGYDRQGMLEAGGIALDARGRLWVAETLDAPKRISVWDTMTGENLAEYFGAAGYFSYGFIDPDRPDEILAHNVLWEIDWHNNTTRPKSTIWRQRSPNMMVEPGPYAYANVSRLVTAANGIQYLWGNTVWASVLMRREGDIFKPTAALLVNNGQSGIELLDNDDHSFPKDRRSQPVYLWQDTNNDQTVQRDELTMLPKEYGRARFASLAKDLSVRVSGGQGGAALWRPVRVETNGRPVFDPAQGETVPVGTPLADGSVLNLVQNGGKTNEGTLPGPGLYREFPDGSKPWQYPDMIAWRHSLNLPIVKAGRLWAMTGLMGVAGDVFAYQTYWGPNQLFRTDGQYVGAILFDRREVGRGPYAGQSEGQGGSFVRLRLDGKDRTFAIGGSNDVRVWEVLGLDSIRDLPGSTYVHTADHVAKAQAAKDAYEAAVFGNTIVRIVPGGKGALTTAPAASRKLEGGRGFDVRVTRDDQNLYFRFEVQSPSSLANATPDPKIIFRGGNLLDIQLATDPAATADRTTPAPGDVRLLVTRRDSKPFAVLFQPQVKGFQGEPVILKSPTGQESFDQIRVVDEVGLEYEKTAEGFIATVTVPRALTGLGLEPGRPIRLDLGYVFGNGDGTRSTTRAYLFNDSFTANVVDDIPNESRLEPAKWGEAEVQ